MESPRIVKSAGYTQLRVYSSAIYPISSPNGSTIILYAREGGVRIIWRGGEGFKQQASSRHVPKPPKYPPKLQTNGMDSDDAMTIDLSTDEEPNAPAYEAYEAADEAESKADNKDLVSSGYYPASVKHIDLDFGTDALQLALPVLSKSTNPPSALSMPPLFSESIVFAAACSDGSVRVVALPLVPPLPSSKAAAKSRAQGRYGEQVITLFSKSGRRSVPIGVDLSWTSPDSDDMEADPMDDAEGVPEIKTQLQVSKTLRSLSKGTWTLVIASHSAEATGLLRMAWIPIVSTDGRLSLSSGGLDVRKVHVPSPVRKLSFNTSLYPSKRRSHLLVVDLKGVLRLYDTFFNQASSHDQNMTSSGDWLATLSSSFDSSSGMPVRKPILDAVWIFGGKAILVLLSDGEWGIWDIEGIGPGARKGLLRNGMGSRGVAGGATASFAIHGFLVTERIPALSSSTKKSHGNLPGETDRGPKLAPMTPHTRKIRAETLFLGPVTGAGVSTGGIATIPIIPDGSGQGEDEFVTLWYGNNVYQISSLMSYWKRAASDPENSLQSPGISKIDLIDFQGERNNGITHFPTEPGTKDFKDLLVTAEHRLIILTSPHRPPTTSSFQLRLGAAATNTYQRPVEQQLLSRGELDIESMNRLLDTMSGEPRVPSLKSVGFVGV